MTVYPLSFLRVGRHGAPSGKRVLDLTLILLALPVLLPVFALLALLVRVTSRGPVFFVQTRIGRGGVPFGMVKFRSMVPEAEALRAGLLAQSDREGLCFKSRGDPRVTGFGRFLRRSSLDELPQLINVWKGEMSLVGPRPALPEEVAAYPARACRRLEAVPGITGPWQVAGRAELGFDEMVTLDLAYIDGARGLRGDLALLAQTLRAVISGRGAY